MTNYLMNLLDGSIDRAAMPQPLRPLLFAPPPYRLGALGVGSIPVAVNTEPDPFEDAGEEESDQAPNPRTPARPSGNASRYHPEDAMAFKPSNDEPRRAATDGSLELRGQFETRLDSTPTPSYTEPARRSATVEAELTPRESRLLANPLETIRVQESVQAPRADEKILLAKLLTLMPPPLTITQAQDGLIAENSISPESSADTQTERPVVNAIEDHKGAYQPRRQSDDELPPVQPLLPPLPAVQPHRPQLEATPQQLLSPAQPLVEAVPVATGLPTIQVTIGRIEVRASGATQSQPRKSASGPKLTLDAYLQQRDGRNGGTR